MATPITWRNINSDQVSGASRALSGAQQAVQDTSKSLMDLVTQANQVNTDNRTALVKSNTQDFLDQVSGKTAAQLADPAMQSQLEQQRLGYGGMIDRAATRNAALSQGEMLQKAALDTMQYNDKSQELAQRPIQEQVAAKIAAGDTAGAQQLALESHLQNAPDVMAKITAAQRALTDDKYKAQDQEWQRQTTASSLASAALGRQATQENLNYSRFAHAEQRKDIENQHAADNAVGQINLDYQNKQQEQATAIDKLATDLNLPRVQGTNQVDYNALTPNQASSLSDSLKSQELGDNYSATQRNSDILDKLKTLPPSVQAGALKNANALDALRGVAEVDKPRMQQYVSDATKDSTIALTQLTNREKAEKERNIFLNSSNDPDKDGVSVVEGAIKGAGGDLPNDSTKETMIKDTTKALRDGLDITIDGKSIRVKVPPNLLANAYAAVGHNQSSNWFGWNSYEPGAVKKYLTDAITSSPELMAQAKAAPELIGAFAKQKINLSRKLESDQADAISSFTVKNGGPSDTQSIMDKLDRIAKQRK